METQTSGHESMGLWRGPERTYLLWLIAVLVIAMPLRLGWGFFSTVHRWHWFTFAIFCLVFLGTKASGMRRSVWVIASSLFLGIMSIVYGSPWSLRERFFGDLERVEIGCSRSDVSKILGLYHRRPTRSVVEGVAQECEMFRHSDQGPDEFDIAIICYEGSVVVSVMISAD